ncbi:MAG: prepilin peptidase [candidate division Zixibacteria bacterium]|nr:prepilin peptidase [candidate division Zixibacteria bacterium]MBU1469942.1 prepilin peptidase [candidate division Zixibacteria bacterium]MBU2626961.1 prepilin peptidase [candidate division Zixibacteria bacterium]
MDMTLSTEFIFAYAVLFLAGLAIGSFLNVVIYRLPRSKSLLWPRSACPTCGKTIPFYLNIPIFSYLMLLGKCRYCKTRISPRYLIIEFISGVVVVGYFAHFGLNWQGLAAMILTLTLIPVFFIDFEHRIIPDSISIPGIVVGFGLSLLTAEPGWLGSLIGILIGGGGLLLIGLLGDFIFKKESLGGGDVKLAAMLGAFLGWEKVLFVFIGSAVLGLIGAVILLAVSKNVRENHQIPFGPFLAAAAVIALLFGDKLIGLYISHFLTV